MTMLANLKKRNKEEKSGRARCLLCESYSSFNWIDTKIKFCTEYGSLIFTSYVCITCSSEIIAGTEKAKYYVSRFVGIFGGMGPEFVLRLSNLYVDNFNKTIILSKSEEEFSKDIYDYFSQFEEENVN